MGGLTGRRGSTDAGSNERVIGVLESSLALSSVLQREGMETYVIRESVAVPVPSVEQLDAVAFSLGPGVSVAQRGVKSKDGNAQAEEYNGTQTAEKWVVLERHATWEGQTAGGEVKDLRQRNDGKV